MPENKAALVFMALIAGCLILSILFAQNPVSEQPATATADNSQVVTIPGQVSASAVILPADSYYQSTEECTPLATDLEHLDLVQQCRVAASTEYMASFALPQFLIGVFGVIFIGWTLHETRNAAEAANKTIETFVKAERAILSIDSFSVTRNDGDSVLLGIYERLDIAFTAKNSGKTPALDIASIIRTYTVEGADFDLLRTGINQEVIEPKLGLFKSPMEPGTKKITTRFPVTVENWKRINEKSATAFLYGKVTYKDVFGTQHFFNFGYRLSVSNITNSITVHKLTDPSFWEASQ